MTPGRGMGEGLAERAVWDGFGERQDGAEVSVGMDGEAC
jgi:hypothetical protein